MAMHNRAVALLLAACALLPAADAPARLYTIQTVAGNDSNGDGGPALSAFLGQAEGIAVDGQGSVYVADAADNRIRKITPDGAIQTLAGTGPAGFAGDGGQAAVALLNQPYGLAVDAAGNLYVADLGNARVRKISLDGTIQTVAGGGLMVPGPNVSGIAAVNAQLFEPRNVAVDPDGTLYISDFGAHVVYQVSPSGVLTTLAGTGNAGFSGDGSTARLAQLRAPAGIASDGNGSVYIADSGNNRIRKVSHGVISSFYTLSAPIGVAVNAAGTLYIASTGYFGTQFKAIAGVTPSTDVALDRAGNAYVTAGQFVRKVTAASGVFLIAGSGASRYFGGDSGPAGAARLHAPSGIAQDRSGNWYIADSANNRIRKITPAGIISTIAGTGDAGSKGDNGQAMLAQLNGPLSVAVDWLGSVYIADTGNNALRKISPGGGISTVSTQLSAPGYVAVGPDQSVYVADSGNNRVVQVDSSGVVNTVTQVLAPSAVMVDTAGDVYVSTQSSVLKLSAAATLSVVLTGLNAPRGLALTPDGDLLVVETGANVIRRISSSNVVTVIAGCGVAGYSGDGGAATSGRLNTPEDLAMDASGGIWVADSANNRLRSLTPAAAPANSLAAMTLLNAASMAAGPVAAGEIVTIFGAGFQPNQTQVLFDGQQATLFYTGAGQINALAPAQLAQPTADISIVVNGLKIAEWSSPVSAAAPGIFTTANGTGQAAAINEDGSINSASNPAARGSIVSFYATGQGVGSGAIGLTIGNYAADLLYASAAPGFPGLMQINARVPGGFLGPGIQTVVLSVGNVSSQNGVTVAIR